MTGRPTLAMLLAERKNQIVYQWMEQVRADVAAAASANVPTLANNVPQFIESLAAALQSGASDCVALTFRLSEEHGRERAKVLAYTLLEILHEYSLLRRTIFGVLDAERTLTPEERNVLLDGLDQASKAAAVTFMECRAEEDRRARQVAERERDQFKLGIESLRLQSVAAEA